MPPLLSMWHGKTTRGARRCMLARALRQALSAHRSDAPAPTLTPGLLCLRSRHAGMAATAALYMHKFYMHQSFTDVPHLPMATSCLYLAYKVDSRPKLLGRPEDFLKDLIKNSYNLVTGASASGKEPWTETLAETLMKDFCYHERLLLASLGVAPARYLCDVARMKGA